MSETQTAAPVAESTPIADTGSLSEHEAAYHGPVESRTPIAAPPAVDDDAGEVEETGVVENPPAADGTRDAQGRFVQKERHRAASQKASPDDVAKINEWTKRVKAAEAAEGADITREEGESERVFNLRRRAMILERRKTAAAPPPAPARQPVSRPTPPQPAAASSAQTPPKPDASEIGTKYATYEDFTLALAEWGADRRFEAREAERVKEKLAADAKAEGDRIASSFNEKITAAKAKYPDFQQVALDAPTRIPAGSAIDLFVLQDDGGADVLYYLQQHGDELTALLSQTPLQQVKALSLLSQRLTTPAAAVSTGAAPRTNSQPAPKPPTPVRGGPTRTAEEPPDPETSSLKDHERFFHKKR